MRTMTSLFPVKSEDGLRKLMGRLTAAQGVVSLNKETFNPPHRNTLQRFSDWLAGIPKTEPEVLYSFSADSSILIDGKYNPESVAEQIMRLLPAGIAASYSEIDTECGERRTIGIKSGRMSKTTAPIE